MSRRVLVLAVAALMIGSALWLTQRDAAAQAGGGEKVRLNPKFLPGEYLQVITIDMTQVTKAAGQEVNIEMKETIEIAISVGRPDDAGVITAQLKFKRLTQSLTQGGLTRTFDSAKPREGDADLRKALQPLTGAAIQMVIGPDGKVQKLVGLDKVWEQMAGELGPLAEQFKKSFGDETIRRMVEKTAAYVPKQPVGPGDSWKVDEPIELPFLGKAKVAKTCQLKSFQNTPAGQVAAVSLTGKLEAAGQEIRVGGAVVQVKNLSFDFRGEMTLNAANFMLCGSTMSMDGKMDMDVTAPGSDESQPATTTLKMTVTAESGPAKKPTTAPETAPDAATP